MAAPQKVKLKFYVDTNAEKVLFAEADKYFIDFLIYLLSLPLGTVAKLLKGIDMIGCFGSLYESLEQLNETYLQPNQTKNSLLNPKPPVYTTEVPLLLSSLQLTSRASYRCQSHNYTADVPNLFCPLCKTKMANTMTYVAPSTTNTGYVTGGFVKNCVIYLLLDNFEFTSMSAEIVFALLNDFKVKNVSTLEKIDVELGVEEALMLLKLSFESKTVLTSFYFENKKA
ncbi:DUF674 family protein [Melia azedarach]|uniref:DUF674 family protein n=1 Tax=Melia azedarach TaxID=155640 RepID=A0ACC1Y9A6_MELAZ|nr:DUF674 family protein [Melia azedarach]